MPSLPPNHHHPHTHTPTLPHTRVRAGGRQFWSELRERSGSAPALLPERLTNGQRRSLLGAVVDPAGLFRQSGLVNTDGRDRAALEAASKLTHLARELLAEGQQATGLAEGDPSPLSESARQQEQQELVRALTSKAWERRDDLRVVTRRIAAEALDQAASRVSI